MPVINNNLVTTVLPEIVTNKSVNPFSIKREFFYTINRLKTS